MTILIFAAVDNIAVCILYFISFQSKLLENQSPKEDDHSKTEARTKPHKEAGNATEADSHRKKEKRWVILLVQE